MARSACRGGYSLLELLIVLAIAGTLATLGQGLVGLVERERGVLAVLELRRMLNFARGEAVNLQTRVTLCALDSAGHCQREWQGREIGIFLDSNHNRRLDNGEALRLAQWPENLGQLQWRAALGRRYLTFEAGGDTAQNGSFLLCRSGSGTQADVVVVVNRGGRNYVGEPGKRRCS